MLTTFANSNYNYYPNTMIALCVSSYKDPSTIVNEVNAMGLQVVWGPVFKGIDWFLSYSAMFVVLNPATEEYTVVIRGTNPVSLYSWLYEDFDVSTTQPFNTLAPHAPASALISTATYNGLTDLLSMSSNGQSVAEYLQTVQPGYLYVTGHSLGGTLTPPMFAYLNDVLYGGGYVHNMAYWSFAGLTSGDAGFAAYFNSLGNPAFPGRLVNPLDIAPLCFPSGGLENVYNIYGYYGLYISDLDPIWGLLDYLFSSAADNNLTQPQGSETLPAVFSENYPGDWPLQAAYQHHTTTYQQLVAMQYPM